MIEEFEEAGVLNKTRRRHPPSVESS